jgi:mannose-6-phosphate isomerase-like protein (cupin superfamily)
MNIRKVENSFNLETIRDGRGGIFTFLPHEPIVEFNFQFVNKGKVRGNHYHPEFDEYYLFTDGNAVVVSKSPEGTEESIHVGRGDCVHIPAGVSHVTYAITDLTLVTFLTKKWDDCIQPIVHENMGMGTGDHSDPAYRPLGN